MHYGQVHQDLGLEDHAAIAKTVEDLGDQFRTAMRAGWFPTCVRPIRRTQPLLPAPPWGRARWCFQAESNLLPFDTNSNLA